MNGGSEVGLNKEGPHGTLQNPILGKNIYLIRFQLIQHNQANCLGMQLFTNIVKAGDLFCSPAVRQVSKSGNLQVVSCQGLWTFDEILQGKVRAGVICHDLMRFKLNRDSSNMGQSQMSRVYKFGCVTSTYCGTKFWS